MDRSGKPFSIKRMVRWGDCDPAGIVYSPRVFDNAVETVEVQKKVCKGKKGQ